MADALQHTELRYGTENELQTVGVWQFPSDEPPPPESEATAYWFM